ncbi:transposase [Candidatus Dependentiae bacterium]|nr:transposase [Candidatus Dependentiae bacterium]
MECFFTAHKRYSNSGKSSNIVYIISSLNIPAKEQAKTYNIRWNIEKMFRTTKQSLGLVDCQCLEIEKQRTHILSVFFAFAKLEEQKIFKRKKSIEQVLMDLRIQKIYMKNFQSYLLEQAIMH